MVKTDRSEVSSGLTPVALVAVTSKSFNCMSIVSSVPDRSRVLGYVCSGKCWDSTAVLEAASTASRSRFLDSKTLIRLCRYEYGKPQ